MRYLICWIFPPLAVFLCGKPIQAILNFILFFTCIGTPFAILWGYLTVREFYADQRNNRLMKALRKTRTS